MRNAEVIAHINEKIAAALRAAGANIATIPLAELEAGASLSRPFPTRPYLEAITTEIRERTFPRDTPRPPIGDDELPPLAPEEEAFLAGESYDIVEAVHDFDDFVVMSCDNNPNEYTLQVEEVALESIPARFRPGAREEREQAEAEIQAAFMALDSMPEDKRRRTNAFVVRAASRLMPPDFEPRGTAPEQVWAERALAGWCELRNRRDDLVRAALAAGVTKSRAAELTGLSRVTIDRIA